MEHAVLMYLLYTKKYDKYFKSIYGSFFPSNISKFMLLSLTFLNAPKFREKNTET